MRFIRALAFLALATPSLVGGATHGDGALVGQPTDAVDTASEIELGLVEAQEENDRRELGGYNWGYYGGYYGGYGGFYGGGYGGYGGFYGPAWYGSYFGYGWPTYGYGYGNGYNAWYDTLCKTCCFHICVPRAILLSITLEGAYAHPIPLNV